ncbi:MAG TPA: hypothetical protein DDY88_03175 [Actinobacteria bacterium]|nr:hypothetical protein [Actinomycetota bacterium]
MNAERPVGVIVVAEPTVHALLVASGAQWLIEPRQESVAQMWSGLSTGALNAQSRILVFSDSLAAGTARAPAELHDTALAVITMAQAGARVFIASSGPVARAALLARVDAEASTRDVEVAGLGLCILELELGGRSVLETIAKQSGDLVQFPPALPAEIDVILGQSGLPATAVQDFIRLRMPELPPIGGAFSKAPIAELVDELPPSASRELLDRPRPEGQLTITVTSSKGGSGKSTASIMLAASIARASARAGKPLSVCIVDLDTRDGQVASLIGRFMPTALNIRVQPVWDEASIRRNLVHADSLGIDCLLAPIRPRTADTVGPDFYRAIVRSLQRMYDVIVMDTSVQYLEPLIAKVALVEADEILFVTNLASTAVQGMARALREITAPVDESGLGIPREKLGIIVNQSAADVGMEQEQVLAAGLGMPVVGVIPLATRDVLTATNLNRMHELLDHPLVGPSYHELAVSCLPNALLAPWEGSPMPTALDEAGMPVYEKFDPETERRHMSYKR